MDAVWRNVPNQHYADAQRPGIAPVDNEAAAGARQNNDIGGVEGMVTEGLKSATVQAFLSARHIPMKLRSIAGLPMDDFKMMSGELKKATRKSDQDAMAKIARDYLEKVFAKVDSKEMLTRIKEATGLQDFAPFASTESPVATDCVNKAESRKRPLGDNPEIDPKEWAKTETSTVSETGGSLQDASGLDQPDVSASEEPSLKIPNEDYIKSLDDTDLMKMRTNNLEYDMDTGRYSYDAAMTYRYNRPGEVNSAMRRHPGSRSGGRYGMVTGMSSFHPSAVPEIVRTGSESGWAPFCNGDTVVIRTFQQLDKHAANMSFLLKSLELAICSHGLPKGLKELAIKVAVTDGYRVSNVLRVFKVRDGFVSSMENDPDNLVAADNLLRITFNRKSDMAELFAVVSWRDYKATGKTLGELERNNQVTLTMESTCDETIQGEIMTQCRSLPVLLDAPLNNVAQQVSAKTYIFENMAFRGPYGGQQ